MRELPGLNSGTKLTPSLSQASGKVTPEARPAASGVISVPTSTFALPVQEGELLTARVVKALPDNRAVIDIGGQTLVAETKIPLAEGQEMLLEARGLQEGKVLLHLLAVGKNPYTGSGQQARLANLLAQAGLALTQENLVILQYLMAEKAQITGPLLKEIARSLQSLGKFDRETVRAAVFLTVRGLPVNAENIKLAGLILREGVGLGSALGRVLAQFQNLAGAGSTQPVWDDASGDTLININDTISTHPNATNITNTNGASINNINENSTQEINTREAQGNNSANAAQNGRPGTGDPVSAPLDRESSAAKDNIQQAELNRLAEAARNTVSQRAGAQPEQTRQALPGQLLTTGAGQETTGPEKPDLRTFLVAVLKSLLTLELGENGQGGAQLAPGTLEAQLKLTGEAWQAKSLLGKILAGISHSQQSPGEALPPGVFPQQEALQQAEITMPEQVIKQSGAMEVQEDLKQQVGFKPQESLLQQQILQQEGLQRESLQQEKIQPHDAGRLKARSHEQQINQLPGRLPGQEVNPHPECQAVSRIFTVRTEQLRDILSARELLQVSYQKSDESFIGYFPLPVQVEDRFLGADLYIWRRKPKEKGAENEQGTGDNKGTGESGFHVLFLLNTSSLGSWRIDLVTRGENLSINMAVNQEDVSRLVKNRLGELKEKVEAQGYKVNHLNCQVVRNKPGETSEHKQGTLKANSKGNEGGNGKESSGPFATGVDLRV